ncbi:hypothetical protein [Arthrobacter sp. MDT1-65]
MAGYVHKQPKQYTPAQIERIRRLQAEVDAQAEAVERMHAENLRLLEDETKQLLDLKLRRLMSQKRMAQHRLDKAIRREVEETGGEEARRELERIQAQRPQPAGIGAVRMAIILRAEDSWKAEKASRSMRSESYDMAA